MTGTDFAGDMKGEESPDISKRNADRDVKILSQISSTPKTKIIGLEELHLLGLHRDCSPITYGSPQDKLEIGWGDSPEPLNIAEKAKLYSKPVACKKRLEAKESPKSRCRNIRPSIRPPQPSTKPPVDVSKYLAELQELSRRILSERESSKLTDDKSEKENQICRQDHPMTDLFDGDEATDEYLIACTQSLESRMREKEPAQASSSSSHNTNNDSAFEKVLQSFINEEDDDDWLSQALTNVEGKATPRKSCSFAKTKSENLLESPVSSRRPKGIGPITTFRRTHSSDRFEMNEGRRREATESGRPAREKSDVGIGKTVNYRTVIPQKRSFR